MEANKKTSASFITKFSHHFFQKENVMFKQKFLNIIVSVIVMLSLLSSGIAPASARTMAPAPTNPTDETKIPHYFGPYPNYANSPQAVADATVQISGAGSGATAAATVDPATGKVIGVDVVTPGSGYQAGSTNVTINGIGSGATASAQVSTSGVVTAINVVDAGGGYTKPVASLSGGGGSGVLVTVGNPLIDRAFATDYQTAPTIVAASVTPVAADTFNVNIGSAIGGTFLLSVDAITTAPIAWNALAADVASALTTAGLTATVTGSGSIADPWVIVFNPAPAAVTIDGSALTQPVAPAIVPVFVVVPTALPAGSLQAFEAWNQATSGGSPTPSAGQTFNAYLLRPLAGNQYQVVFDSGALTVPALADPAVSAAATFPLVTPIPVLAGDVIAFYGAGIPVDTGSGADLFSFPAPTAPAQGATITVGDPATFPLYGQARTYSFAAKVVDNSAVLPVVNATATVYGGVDVVTVTDGGANYTQNATVDFDLPDDPNGVQATGAVAVDANGVVTGVTVVNPGSGYLTPPAVTIIDGMTRWDTGPGANAAATATLKVTNIMLDTFGSGYVTAPDVKITDALGTGGGATASALVDTGAIIGITVNNQGSGYITPGLKKFTDPLPGLCNPAVAGSCPTSGKYIPLAVPDTSNPYQTTTGPASDTYEIGLVQYHMQFSSQLPPSLVRGYVQLETPANAGISQHFPLVNELMDGSSVPVLVNGVQAYGVTPPQYLGPTIVATRDRPVRIVFRNLLPTLNDGNLFLPVDSTIMGSGMDPTMLGMQPMDTGSVLDEVRNPMCGELLPGGKKWGCFTENRATLHLHGGVTPWISDGTPHQWITPAGENAAYPQGVSVQNVPDMNVCGDAHDGCQTFFYTNQQSARLMFYHDHAWGITRLNVYAGEAAGYLITDSTEQKLINSGTIPSDQIPLIIQDKTFVSKNIAQQDPTWDTARWGGEGALWSPHVYMPAQNPGDPSGMSAFGRWMYGPWFWPPAKDAVYPPINNPYYDPACDPNVAEFCEPPLIPGTPNISVGMEAFNDTPVVNGTAYPTLELQPKSYRLRVLNAANDRFWNLQWYVGDPSTANPQTGITEVALKAAEVAAAQTDINISPTPDTAKSPVGPSWIQIGTEGGFLPAPVVVPNQPTTWITDPTRFDVGNVDKHSLLLAPAERADVIVDFSKYAGKTLILYNDAPAAFPARVASYDYYTGGPDLSPAGAPTTLPGYGPNTRTVMQVKIAAATPAAAFNLTNLVNAFKHHADGSGVFESGQHPIIVGQAAYNSAYGTNFVSSGWCNAPKNPSARCDGFARINEQGGDLFGFNTLRSPNTTFKQIPFEPKGIHDEMNSSSFDEFGRMTANLGLEAVPATPGLQNVTLYPYINPTTEFIDGTNLPQGDLNVTPISTTDGAQIWKITHNGVDTHPIHFHLYDVQVINRVTWDNIIMPPDATELGWKDTVRVSPLQDTIVALRPIVPTLPFEVPNSIRELNPMMPDGNQVGFNNIDGNGNPTAPVINQLVNFGWEYVYHCHILSHEEMDMMRPVTLAVPPKKADGLSYTVSGNGNKKNLTLSWNDNSIAETAYLVQRDAGTGFVTLGTIPSPLNQPNTKGVRTFVDTNFNANANYTYKVIAQNTVGYGGDFPSMTVISTSASLFVGPPPAAPSNLTASQQSNVAAAQVNLAWRDNASNETSFNIMKSTDGGGFAVLATLAARAGTGNMAYADQAVAAGHTYAYNITAANQFGTSAPSNTATVIVIAIPAAPSNVTATASLGAGNNRTVTVRWTDNSTNETGFTIQRATNAGFTAGLTSVNVAANATSFVQTGLSRNTSYYFRVTANNGAIASPWANAFPFPVVTAP
jgi:FtsP/CotA-like multicopper oxidase with cupredoxin domain